MGIYSGEEKFLSTRGDEFIKKLKLLLDEYEAGIGVVNHAHRDDEPDFRMELDFCRGSSKEVDLGNYISGDGIAEPLYFRNGFGDT